MQAQVRTFSLLLLSCTLVQDFAQPAPATNASGASTNLEAQTRRRFQRLTNQALANTNDTRSTPQFPAFPALPSPGTLRSNAAAARATRTNLPLATNAVVAAPTTVIDQSQVITV